MMKRTENSYLLVPMKRTVRATLEFSAPMILKRATDIVHAEYGPKRPLKIGGSVYLDAAASTMACKFDAEAAALSIKAWEICILRCRLSCARDCAATASYCSFCSLYMFSAFRSDCPSDISKFRSRYKG